MPTSIRARRTSTRSTSPPSRARGNRALEKLAQLRLQHLAVVVLRQRLDEPIFPGALEAGDVLQAQPVELFPGDGFARDDESDDLLSPFRVRPADHRAFGDGRMAEQHFLDLARIDVRAAGDDHVLRAVA